MRTKKLLTIAMNFLLLASYFLLPTSYFLLASSCSLPRIIVLDDPLTPEEHINLGVAYERNGEFESAIREYEAASGKLPVAYLYLGNVYFQKKKFDEAEEYYRKAIDKDPENADAHNNLAWLYYTKAEGLRLKAEGMGNLEEAEALALRAIELNPIKKEIYLDTLEKIRAVKAAR